VTTGTLGSPGAHGEHVAGTATGAANPAGPVARYGVASDADLYKVNVFESGAYTSDIIAAIQWSVQNDADVASMSLGFGPVDGLSTIQVSMETAMQNAEDAGTVVIGSAGNSGNGAAGGPVTSPGGEFTGFSIGASDVNRDIANFSSGTVVTPNTALVYGGDYPDHYPREFVKPDVSAPGVQVLSAGPVGSVVSQNPTYSVTSGTSMAAPHAAGAVALIQAATPTEHSPEAIENALAETAEKPAGAPGAANERDIRYGTGIINVTAATMALTETADVSGTVTDADTGDALTGVKITTDTGVITSTQNGDYSMPVTTGDGSSIEVTADEFGYTAETQTVSLSGSSTNAIADFSLSPEVAVDLVQDAPFWAEYQDSYTMVVDARNLEEYTVNLADAQGVSESDVNVSIAGQSVDFGQTLTFNSPVSQDGVPVTVEIDGDFSEQDQFALEHTFGGPGNDLTVQTRTTKLTEDQQPAEFDLSGFSAPPGQDIGQAEPYFATVTVTNNGQTSGDAAIRWFLGPLGLLGDDPVVSLAPGQSEDVSLNFGEIDIGAFFGDLPVSLFQGFEADPVDEAATGDMTQTTFEVGDGSIPLYDPIGVSRDAGETSTVYDATLTIQDQSFENPTSEVTVDTSNLQPADEYVIVIHEATEGMPVLGNSGDLSGSQSDVTVSVDQIDETTDVVAMMHFASDNSAFGAPIPQYTEGAGVVTDTAQIEIQPPGPVFEVTDYSGPSEALEGEDISASATIENVGDEAGTREVALDLWTEVGGSFITAFNTTTLTLNPGESTTVDLSGTASEDSGDYALAITAWNASVGEEVEGQDGAPFTINEPQPANFEVTNLNAPSDAAENETITVNATVTNTGDMTGTQDVLFKLDDQGDFDNPDVEEVAEAGLTLDPGQSQQVEITVEAPGQTGEYQHGMFSDNDSQTTMLVVGNPQVIGTLSDESASVGDTINVDFGIESYDGTDRNISGYTLVITFDPNVIDFVDATGVDMSDPTVNDTAADQGVVEMIAVDTASPSTPLTAARLEFDVVGTGDTDITVDREDSDIQGPGGTPRNPIWEDGSVSASSGTVASTTAVVAV